MISGTPDFEPTICEEHLYYLAGGVAFHLTTSLNCLYYSTYYCTCQQEVSKKKAFIRKEVTDTRVTLNGYVVADDDAWIYRWFGYSVFSPAVVRQAIRDNPEGEELVLEINSGGGSVFAGFEMYSVLRSAKCKTRAEVQSLAASAASTLMLGADEVWVSPVAQVMVHLPSTSTEGDRRDHLESVGVLDSLTESILNGYEAKCRGKRSRDELARMMRSSTWLSAQEALDAGLADGILYQEGTEPLPGQIVNAVGGGIRALANGGGLPDAGQLRARYEALGSPPPDPNRPNQGGAPGSHTQDGWQAQAALDIEKFRF